MTPMCSGKSFHRSGRLGYGFDLPCQFRATTEHEGHPYCKKHHPILAEAYRVKRVDDAMKRHNAKMRHRQMVRGR